MSIVPTPSKGLFVALLLAAWWTPKTRAATGVPLTDMILFGRVFDPAGGQVTGSLPAGKGIAVFVDGLLTPDEGGGPARPTVLAQTAKLLDDGSGTAQYYVLRIRRLEGASTDHNSTDDFVLAGDRLHVIVDWDGDGLYEESEEVAETRDTSQLVTDAASDVRLLHLNGTLNDADGDGLPDDWEQFFLGGLDQDWNDDTNHDKVNNGLAWAMGLNPNLLNTSKLPFLQKDQNGNLVIFFRQSTEAALVSYQLEASATMEADGWTPVANATIEEVGVEGTSRILKATVTEGFAQGARFYRVNWR